MPASPPDWAVQFLADRSVGHLATASAGAAPHVIPVCFVLHGSEIYTVVDEKPKSGRRLLRLRNIDATGCAALVADHYDDDWTRLAFVLVRGPARVITAGNPAYGPVLAALRRKYPQYQTMSLEESEMIELRPARWTAWRADELNLEVNE